MQLTLFSLDGLFVFKGNYRVSNPLPKFACVGSDTKAQTYVQAALKQIVQLSRQAFKVSDAGHFVKLSSDPVILSGDGAVKSMYTGGPTPTDTACAIYEVSITSLKKVIKKKIIKMFFFGCLPIFGKSCKKKDYQNVFFWMFLQNI